MAEHGTYVTSEIQADGTVTAIRSETVVQRLIHAAARTSAPT